MKINTIVFDLDGTLLNTLEDLTCAVNHALAAFAMPSRSIDEVRSFVGNGIRRLMVLSVPNGEANPLFEEAFAEFKKYYDAHCNDKTRPYEGIGELLDELKNRGIKLAIVSNKVDSAVQTLRDTYFPQVGVAVGDREGLKRKPAPDGTLLALSECGADKETAVYVGDSEVDLATAKNAGLKCVSALWGFRDRELLEQQGAEIFIEKPQELLELIDNEII